MTATISLDEIPGPRGLPVLGNVRDLDADAPIESLMRLADEYGPIYKLAIPGGYAADRHRPGAAGRDLRRRTLRQEGQRRPGGPPRRDGDVRPVHLRHAGPACGTGRTTS